MKEMCFEVQSFVTTLILFNVVLKRATINDKNLSFQDTDQCNNE
jgi:hypothetical protein